MPSSVKKDDVVISKSTKPGKKYKAVFSGGSTFHFGSTAYQQFKDSTGLGAYSRNHHGDLKRRANFHARHGCAREPKKSAGYLSCKYLW